MPPGARLGLRHPEPTERTVLLSLAVLLLVLALLALDYMPQRRQPVPAGRVANRRSAPPPPAASFRTPQAGPAETGPSSSASVAQPTSNALLAPGGAPSRGQPAVEAVAAVDSGPPPVSCQSDLPLSQSPNAPYNFLCIQNGRPITWAAGQVIDLYTSGLTPVQNTSLPGALSQWEAEGGFSVVQVSSADAANVTIDDAPLGGSEAGSATVRYQCTTAACFYAHGAVHLSSTAPLTQTLWASTILHELGHIAGLNHVSRAEEVLYPIITDTSPDAYTPGDLQGLQALATARQSSPAAAGGAPVVEAGTGAARTVTETTRFVRSPRARAHGHTGARRRSGTARRRRSVITTVGRRAPDTRAGSPQPLRGEATHA